MHYDDDRIEVRFLLDGQVVQTRRVTNKRLFENLCSGKYIRVAGHSVVIMVVSYIAELGRDWVEVKVIKR